MILLNLSTNIDAEQVAQGLIIVLDVIIWGVMLYLIYGHARIILSQYTLHNHIKKAYKQGFLNELQATFESKLEKEKFFDFSKSILSFLVLALIIYHFVWGDISKAVLFTTYLILHFVVIYRQNIIYDKIERYTNG